MRLRGSRSWRIFAAAAAVLAWASPVRGQGSSESAPAYRATPAAIAGLIDPLVRGRGEFGVAVYSVEQQAPLYLHNADWALVPASNMKLFTTAAALDRLGPDFQYTTSVYADGALLADGMLVGDLVLVGRGDPTISGRFYGDSATYVFDRRSRPAPATPPCRPPCESPRSGSASRARSRASC